MHLEESGDRFSASREKHDVDIYNTQPCGLFELNVMKVKYEWTKPSQNLNLSWR
jgi:hypothetical protein